MAEETLILGGSWLEEVNGCDWTCRAGQVLPLPLFLNLNLNLRRGQIKKKIKIKNPLSRPAGSVTPEANAVVAKRGWLRNIAMPGAAG